MYQNAYIKPPMMKIIVDEHSWLSRVKTLFTKDDQFHHHKILGVLVLASFFVRFNMLPIDADMGFVAYPEWTIPTIALHLMLTVSSFQFKIPLRRIRDGARIWPQYRWHALIFTTRSAALLALFWYEKMNQLQPNYDLSFAIVMLAMASAEFVTYVVGKDFRSNTLRDLDAPAGAKFIASTILFNSTACFVMGIRSFSIPFYAFLSVQITPFLGTLRRKGVFTSTLGGAIAYIIPLLGGIFLQAYQYHGAGGIRMHLFGRSIGLLAALLRMNPFLPKFCWPLQNKFVIWTLLYMYIRAVRSSIDLMDVSVLSCSIATLLVFLGLSAYIKVKSGYYPKDVKAAKILVEQSQ